MLKQLDAHGKPSKPARWAALTLAGAVTAVSAFAMANAQGAAHRLQPDKAKTCSSSVGCVDDTNTSSGPGLEGTNTGSGYGVLGLSSNFQAGLSGQNTFTGSGGSGVYGTSPNGPGVNGSSSDGYGVEAQGGSQSAIALYVVGGSNGIDADDVLQAYNSNKSEFVYFNDTGGIEASGGFSDAVPCRQGCSKTRRVVSYAAQTSEPTLDDVGEATLREGHARVAIDAALANVMDATRPYVVMLTPEGDAGTLYVTNRTPSGFDVRESHAGRSSIGFAYRIVAHPYGRIEQRLPFTASHASTAWPREPHQGA
jgi:hypothetical protein